tara:strand:+ start:2996 stop:3187 length:192 start_codon:yes stop_codon:yes gene_type:complete
MKASSIKEEEGTSQFKMFFLTGEPLRILAELAPEEEQAELIVYLIQKEYERRFKRHVDDSVSK